MEKAITRMAEGIGLERPRGLSAEDFERLVPEHQRRIHRVLMSVTRDTDLAETLTQECFIRAYRCRERYRGEASVETWLLRIAVNLAIDHRKSARHTFWERMRVWRRGQEGGVSARDEADPGTSVEETLVTRESAREVWEAAGGLPTRQRIVFSLRFGEEMSLEEIAETAQMEVGTVKAHLYRAIGALRKRLGERRP
ncbi:MAG: sigma-70 family RNA polymerase sigma factor [Acidobacteria bacterium]|nr:sigma-70 family RNA polymerase sigma factor [Acidobacteriota bacterium]